MRHFHEDAFGVPANPLHCSLGGLFGGGGGGGGGANVEKPASYFANSAPSSLGIAQAMQQGGLPFMQGFQPPFHIPGQQGGGGMPGQPGGGGNPIFDALNRTFGGALGGSQHQGASGGNPFAAMNPTNPGNMDLTRQMMNAWSGGKPSPASFLFGMNQPQGGGQSQVMPGNLGSQFNGLL